MTYIMVKIHKNHDISYCCLHSIIDLEDGSQTPGECISGLSDPDKLKSRL